MIRVVLPHAEGRTRRHERRVRDAVAASHVGRAFLAQTTGMIAVVKSQRPDTPMLVSALMRKHHALWWPTSPAHQGDCV